jgi:hypothetical protein
MNHTGERDSAGVSLLSKGLLFPILGSIPILTSEFWLLYRVMTWSTLHLSEFVLYLILNCFLFTVFGLISFIGWMNGLKGMVLKNRRERRPVGTLSIVMWGVIPVLAFVLLAVFGYVYFFLELSLSHQMLVYALFSTGILLFSGMALGLQVRGKKATTAFVGAMLVLLVAGEIAIAISFFGPLHDYFYFIETTIVQFSGMLLAIPLMVLAFRLTDTPRVRGRHQP